MTFDDSTPLAYLTVGQLRQLLSELRPASSDDDAPRDAKSIGMLIPGTSRGWLKTNVTPACRGARQKPLWRPSDVRRALTASKKPHLSLVRDIDPFLRAG